MLTLLLGCYDNKFLRQKFYSLLDRLKVNPVYLTSMYLVIEYSFWIGTILYANEHNWKIWIEVSLNSCVTIMPFNN